MLEKNPQHRWVDTGEVNLHYCEWPGGEPTLLCIHGLTANATAHQLLDTWLAKQPDPKVLGMWKSYIRKLWPRFTGDEQWEMRQNLLKATREVAEAAGGFLGLTSKISAEERKVLDELESVVE